MDEDQGGPTLVSIGSRGGWKLPALVVVALLAGLVGITRLSVPQGPLPAPPSGFALGPSQEPTLAPQPTLTSQPTLTPQPTPTAEPTRGQITAGLLAGVMPRSADGLTYADGIPTGISGAPVYRIRDVLLVPLGRTMLVGGWYVAHLCRSSGRALTCPTATMSDARLVDGFGHVRTDSVAVDGRLQGSGAHIVLATVEADPSCAIVDRDGCQPRLRVLQQIWSG